MGHYIKNQLKFCITFCMFIGINAVAWAQTATEAQQMEDLSTMRMVVLLVIAFAFVIMFGLIYVVKSHRELKHQYLIIDKQKDEIAEKNEQLAFSNDSLEEMNIEKNNVLSVVAHDLKTPLTNINGLVELIKIKKDKLTKEQIEYLDLITRVVKDGVNMVDNMLDVHKIEAELKEMAMVTIPLFDIIEKVMKLHEPQLISKKVKLQLEMPNKELQIHTDAQYLRQILSNLVSNAIKYTAEETTVIIRVEERDTSVVIKVEDSGKGIDSDQMKRLFAGYKAVQHASEKASPGFGLLITRRLVDKLKGKISITNKTQGTGAIFTVELLK